MLPEDYRRYSLSFLRFIRRISELTEHDIAIRGLYPPMTLPKSRFRLAMIINLDETPIPFQFTDDMTYSLRGEKTISTRSQRSGWDKRQATVMLTIDASGSLELVPLLVFRGEDSKKTGSIFDKESRFYHPDVIVNFNEKAWNNGALFLQWIVEELIPIMKPSEADPVLLAMDCVSFHKTGEVLETLKQNWCQVVMVPPGCTGILQPLDTHVNKVFKAILTRLEEEDATRREEENPLFKWTASKKRIQMTHCVGEAFKILRERHADMIAKSFLDVGLSLPPDGSQDHLLSIKGFPHGEPEIGDYSQTDAEIEAYQHAHVKIPEIGENGEYVLEDGTPLRQYGILNCEQLRAALRARGIPGIGRKDRMIKALMVDDSTHQPGIIELTIEGYTHRDGSQAIPQRQGEMSSTWQISNYRHEQVDMGAWDEDSDEEGTQWPSEEQDMDHEEEAYMDDVYWR